MNNLVNKGDTLNKLRESVNTNTTAMESHLVDENCHLSTSDRAKLENITENATKVSASDVNGNIVVDNEEVTVYTHPAGTNPHGTTKSDVGLGNVDNTSDMDKPISTAVQEAISTHENNSTIHITADERTQWNKAEENVQSDWSVSDSNSDAFIKNKPTSLPASDVSDWAKEPTKPSYTATEVGADPAGSANSALENAKSYTDEEIAGLINGAPTTLDTLGEIADAMAENKTVVDALNDAIGSKANTTDLTAHMTDTNAHISTDERTNWNAAKSHADSAHAPSNAQANVIEIIEVNGIALTPSSKVINIDTTSSIYGSVDTSVDLSSLSPLFDTVDTPNLVPLNTFRIDTESNQVLRPGSILVANFIGGVPSNAYLYLTQYVPIYYKSRPITNGVINDGDTATFIYDGSYYHLIAIDRSCEKSLTVSSTLTLTASGWSDNTQTVSVNVDTSRRNVIDVTPSSLASWNSCGVYASSESSTGITFKCDSVPSVDLTFNISSFLIS